MAQNYIKAAQLAATSPCLCDHLNDLVEFGPNSLEQLEDAYRTFRSHSKPLEFVDVLRVRNDGQIALDPLARSCISNGYVDRFLEDCLAVLNLDTDSAGHYHPEFSQNTWIHDGKCEIEPTKPPEYYSRALLDAMADLRGNNLVTNVGQPGCNSRSYTARQNVIDRLHDENVPVLGYAGFEAAATLHHPYISYRTYDPETMRHKDIGYLVVSTLEAHEVPYEWDGDASEAIKTYP